MTIRVAAVANSVNGQITSGSHMKDGA